MKKVIVTTTINNPTPAIEAFDAMADWTLVVAGDLKTPKGYSLKNGIYLSPADQEKYHKELSDSIGWNNHARRNFGNLIARDLGADVVAVVDDDNIPLDGWGDTLLIDNTVEVDYYDIDIAAFDPIGLTNHNSLWHRGFPIQLLTQRSYKKKSKKRIKVDIQADFWNGDPDIDAFCRMEHAPECTFEPRYFPFAGSKPSPFNSQNIFISNNVLPYYFVLPFISPFGRMGDIWISYHMQALGFNVAYNAPSVYQDRNEHDLTVDLEDEFIGYLKCIDIVNAINEQSYSPEKFWPPQTLATYQVYRNAFQNTGDVTQRRVGNSNR